MVNKSRAIEAVRQKDLYEVLGVSKSASFDEIKASYRKLVLRHHPDKSPAHEKESAALKFQELTAAYTVLSDPVKRSKYDSQGLAALEPNELEVAIDSSSLGMFSTFAAAMFTKLGVPLKTSVPASVIEQAYDGRISTKRIRLGESFPDKSEKGQAQFYEVELSQEDIKQGFVIGAHSKQGSKFKILLFESTGSRRWELSEQEDSESIAGGISVASLFFTSSRPYTLAPKNALEAAKDPENQLFMTLESLAKREELLVKPGRCMFAIYNDNWFKRAQYTVSLVLPHAKAGAKVAFTDMRTAEDNLVDLQSSIRAFQPEYREAQERWKAAVKKHDNLSHDVEMQLASRQQAHYKMLCQPE